MNFLSSGDGYQLFREEAIKDTYVDKSLLIDTVYRFARKRGKYICVTRPRRFGKSLAANMIAAFFDESTAELSRILFERQQLGALKQEQEEQWQTSPELPLCWPQQGKHKVIRINMINILTPEVRSYQEFYRSLKRMLRDDLRSAYPSASFTEDADLPAMLSSVGDRFIFIIDEWDAVFEAGFMTFGDREAYILFLKSLLKDRSYVDFAYMTGILPIAKYSSGSPLNMFREFTAFQDAVFYPYFGLTEDEIKNVMLQGGFSSPSLDELAFWYDGYVRGFDGVHMFNPTSVSFALADGCCQNNWTGTGPMNEVRDIIRNNVGALRDDVIRMAGGEELEIELDGFSAEKTQISTRNEILSAMVVYGFLTYYNGKLRIPNHELMLKFRSALASESLGLNQTLEESKKLVRATLEQRDDDVARMMEILHNEKIPFFSYNDENSLACVVVVGYLAALNDYIITREEKAGRGYADFLFKPYRSGDPAIILELKYNRSAENAIQSIKERGYLQKFKNHPQILLVGINYSEATKAHTCRTELVQNTVE